MNRVKALVQLGFRVKQFAKNTEVAFSTDKAKLSVKKAEEKKHQCFFFFLSFSFGMVYSNDYPSQKCSILAFKAFPQVI